MAIRMGSARCRDRVVLAHEGEAASGTRGSYTCRHCSTRVVLVRPQTRQYAKGPVAIGAFFRLYASATPHTPDCLYTVPNRLKRLASEAGDEVFAKNGVVYEYRIDVLKTVRGNPSSAEVSEPSSASEPLAPVAAKGSGSNWELVRKTCKTALDLYQLHAAMSGDEPLAGHIRILADGRRLEWNEFFFDHRQPADFARLLRILESQPDMRYAACVTGTIAGFYGKKGDKIGEYLLLQTHAIGESGQQPLRINICSTRPFLRSMASADNLLKTFAACGVLKLQPHTGHPLQRNRIAYLWLNDPREIAIMDTAL